MKRITWNCDFCGKAGLSISASGVVYCRFCGKSYYQTLYDVARRLISDEGKK